MTRVFGSRRPPGAFFLQRKPPKKERAAKSAMETATAVEIDKGRLRQLLLDDFHKLFGKAFAKTAPAFPPLPQRRRRTFSLEKAITNKPPNTKFRLLPLREPLRQLELAGMTEQRELPFPSLEINRQSYKLFGVVTNMDWKGDR